MEQSTWSEVLQEIKQVADQGQQAAADIVRQQKMQRVFEITGRPLIVYAVACTIPTKQLPPRILQMDFSDKLAFHDVTEHLKDHDGVDVLLHSFGGLPEAAEALVEVLRTRFDNGAVHRPADRQERRHDARDVGRRDLDVP